MDLNQAGPRSRIESTLSPPRAKPSFVFPAASRDSAKLVKLVKLVIDVCSRVHDREPTLGDLKGKRGTNPERLLLALQSGVNVNCVIHTRQADKLDRIRVPHPETAPGRGRLRCHPIIGRMHAIPEISNPRGDQMQPIMINIRI